MRKAPILLAVLSLASSLWAADPIIGTWKLNFEESTSRQTGQESPEEIMEVYREIENGQIELMRTPFGTVLTWPIQGGIVNVKVMKGDSSRSFIQTRIAADEWIITILRDGKQIGTRHKKISKDGKTMRQTLRLLNDEGKPVEMLEVYEKQ
jgi:hypothetical protein